MPASSDLHPPGSLIGGRYKIVHVLGQGGMGIVFEAEDTKLRRTVALKFLPKEISGDLQSKMRFLREAQAAAILDHPNICPVYEVDEAEGEMFLTMAFIEGRSLKDRITEGPLPLIEVLHIGVQVSEGLKAAHEKGVVHRDIKPANIMLSGDGQVRITDFGLASREGGVDLTRPQTILGTPAYMSPEQVRGEKTDARTDVWSFGCTLFEMTTGRRPFAGESGQTVRNEILNEAPPKPTSFRADIPQGLEEVILKCLEKNPEDRFLDFEGVLEALKGAKVREKAPGAAALPLADATPSVAVLPFADMSPAKDQDYFGEGLAEEIIHALARLQGIRVVARTSAFALKGLKLDLREIGQMLHVGAVLEGSVRKAGNRLRVTAQLIDAGTGLHLWSERFDREERDVFAIQDEISMAIVDHLKVTLLSGEKHALRKRSTSDIDAYNSYLKGLYFVARPSPESMQKALDFFREALDRDPGFAQAHAGVATVYATLGIMNFASPAEVYPKAKAAVEKAFALDPDLAEALALEAVLKFWFEWNWSAAETIFERLFELNPGDAMSRGQHAWLLMSLGRYEDCRAEIKRALTIDPLMPLLYAWSIGLHAATGCPDEALADFAKLRPIDPNFGLGYFHAGMAHFRKAEWEEAIKIIEEGRRLVIFPGWGEGVMCLCRLRQGDRKGADAIRAQMLEDRKTLPVSPVCLAWASAGLGDMDGAFGWLETAVRERDTLTCFIRVYAEYMVPELMRDPRFGAFCDRLGLPR